MSQRYSSWKDDEEDLSGCLASQPFTTRKVAGRRLSDDEDLSGCLASQPFAARKIAGRRLSDDEEDLSGCLASQSFAARKIAGRRLSDDDEDLSGCLASQPFATRKVASHHSSDDDGDLSGFLLSVPLATEKTVEIDHRQNFVPLERDDMSGEIKVSSGKAVSTRVKSETYFPRAVYSSLSLVSPQRSYHDEPDITGEIKTSEDTGSDWLYLN